MAEPIAVRCSGCKALLKLPATVRAARCPKCGTTIRNPALEEPIEVEAVEDFEEPRPRKSSRLSAELNQDLRDRSSSGRRRRDEDDEDEERPRQRRARAEDEDEDDHPRRRRSDRYDAEDEDRPRRRKRVREPEGDGPWLIAAGAVAACFLITFGGALVVNGLGGLPQGQDGPGAKMGGLIIGFIASLVLIPLGIFGAKNRIAYGRWGGEIRGSMGVTLAMIQAVMGGLVCGFTLYGILCTLVNGR